jgi:hypothetical protein
VLPGRVHNLYRATLAGDLVAGDTLAVQPTTGDSVTVAW